MAHRRKAVGMLAQRNATFRYVGCLAWNHPNEERKESSVTKNQRATNDSTVRAFSHRTATSFCDTVNRADE